MFSFDQSECLVERDEEVFCKYTCVKAKVYGELKRKENEAIYNPVSKMFESKNVIVDKFTNNLCAVNKGKIYFPSHFFLRPDEEKKKISYELSMLFKAENIDLESKFMIFENKTASRCYNLSVVISDYCYDFEGYIDSYTKIKINDFYVCVIEY